MKPHFSSVKNFSLEVWDPPTILWAPKGLVSPALHFAAHAGWLCCMAAVVLGGHPLLQESPVCWGICCKWTALPR